MIFFALISPLIGIYMVEGGHLSWSTGVVGYPNGATLAYAQYLFAVVASATAFIFTGKLLFSRQRAQSKLPTADELLSKQRQFRIFAKRLLWLNIGFGVVFIFGFGSLKVVLGIVDKGTFRSTMGSLGFIPYLFTKTIIPLLLTCLVIMYKYVPKSRKNRILVTSNLFIAFCVAMTWGFKTTGISLLLPAGIIFLWSANVFVMAKYILYAFSVILVAFFIYDSALQSDSLSVFEFLFIRATVLQGDVSWWVWDIYSSGGEFPKYGNTLLAALGDKILQLLGVSRNDLHDWMLYHYDWMINYVTGISLQRTADGHSIVGTPFSEGLIMGGLFGVWLIGSFAGFLIGSIFVSIQSAIHKGRVLKAAILATYFSFNVFSWLVGGGVVQLFHIAVVVGFLIAFSIATTLIPNQRMK